jgi:hypothetical protein
MAPKKAAIKSGAKARAHPPQDAGADTAAAGSGGGGAEVARGEISAFLSGVKTKTADPETNQARALVLKRYQELPRFSAEKRRLIEQWRNDKSCRWVSSLEEKMFAREESSSSAVAGHGTKPAP